MFCIFSCFPFSLIIDVTLFPLVARCTPVAAGGNVAARECSARRELRGGGRALHELDAHVREAARHGGVLREPRPEARRRHSAHAARRSRAPQRQREGQMKH